MRNYSGTTKPNTWYAVFIDPRGKRFHEDDTYRTVSFQFDQAHTVLDLAREALRKRYPEIADKAHMVQFAACGQGIRNSSSHQRSGT